MAVIHDKEITENIVPLFGSEYRIKGRKFKILTKESKDQGTTTSIALLTENHTRNERYQINHKWQWNNLKRLFCNLFSRHDENEEIEIRQNDDFQVIYQPFLTANKSAVPDSSRTRLILEERIPRDVETYIGLDVNDSDIIFLFRETSRIIIPYLHESPKEDDVIACRTLPISEDKDIGKIISNLPNLYKENGLEDINPRECNWKRNGRNNEQVMICKQVEDGRTVYWKVNQDSSALVVTYNRNHAVKGSI